MIKIRLLLSFWIIFTQTPLLADAKTDGDKGIAEVGRGKLIDGMQLLRKSAAAGYAPAQSTLAFILDKAEQDTDAFHWYQQAADSQDAAGLFGLGSMYAKGEATKKDPQKAGQLIKQSAMLDYVLAMRAYANALEYGQLSFNQDRAAAAKWYLKAANAGDTVSIRRLRNAYTNGQLGLPIDPQQAAIWNEKLKPGS